MKIFGNSLLALGLTMALAGPAQAALIYDDDVSGDLAGDQNTPTPIGALSVGVNTVQGFNSQASNVGSGGDTFALDLPDGFSITSIDLIISNYTGSDAFTATFFELPFTNVDQQGGIVGNATVSFDFAAIQSPTALGFSTQYATGNDALTGFNWAWNITVSATPVSATPASATPVPTISAYGLVLTMLGLLIVAGRRLRASAKRS
jgi:hypothetical protein